MSPMEQKQPKTNRSTDADASETEIGIIRTDLEPFSKCVAQSFGPKSTQNTSSAVLSKKAVTAFFDFLS